MQALYGYGAFSHCQPFWCWWAIIQMYRWTIKIATHFIQFLTCWERFFEDMDDVVTGSDSVGNWFQEWFIRPETLDILDRWGQFEAYPSLVAAASSETKAVQTCWISTTVRHLKHSSISTWSHAWVMLPNALFFSDLMKGLQWFGLDIYLWL